MLTHYWFWKKKLGERNRQVCRILARGKMNSILVEFADGFKVITSRNAVRRITPTIIKPDLNLIAKEINDFIEKQIEGLNVHQILRVLEQVGEDVNEFENILDLEIKGHNERAGQNNG